MAFESVRGLAYAAKAWCGSEDELKDYVFNELEGFNLVNNRYNPLGNRELDDIARSISRWTWRYFTSPGAEVDRGVCRREGLMPHIASKKTKQAIGGTYGAKKNAQNKLDRIKAVRKKMLERGDEVTVSALAREVHMSRNTVRKHLQTLDDDPNHRPTAECKEHLNRQRPEDRELRKTVSIRKRPLENPCGRTASTLSETNSSARHPMWDSIDKEESDSDDELMDYEYLDPDSQDKISEKLSRMYYDINDAYDSPDRKYHLE
ncbi:HTH domain-containing protein [Roseivivax halotolerans]|uniref:HTH domain-containing protein n=2 Tax=Roseivivax halotolerans TaxID=93684 RepID=A0A1I6AK91_9RHOB|nr:HTH domain-containing protein [Roseivivax halotolerans]